MLIYSPIVHVLAFVKENKPTQGYMITLIFFIRGGGHAINWPTYKGEEKVLSLIYIPKVILIMLNGEAGKTQGYLQLGSCMLLIFAKFKHQKFYIFHKFSTLHSFLFTLYNSFQLGNGNYTSSTKLYTILTE